MRASVRQLRDDATTVQRITRAIFRLPTPTCNKILYTGKVHVHPEPFLKINNTTSPFVSYIWLVVVKMSVSVRMKCSVTDVVTRASKDV